MSYHNTELRVGFEMDQYTFSEGAGQVTIYIVRENTITISDNFTVEVAMLQSSTATEGAYVIASQVVCEDSELFLSVQQIQITVFLLVHCLSM